VVSHTAVSFLEAFVRIRICAPAIAPAGFGFVIRRFLASLTTHHQSCWGVVINSRSHRSGRLDCGLGTGPTFVTEPWSGVRRTQDDVGMH
jgi:hypothetical protein